MIGGIFALTAAQALGNADTAGKSAKAVSKVHSLQVQNRALQANIAKLLMITEALWEIVRDDKGLNDEVMRKKIFEIDMRDGKLDGKNQRSAIECPNCGHRVSTRHPACLYCGQVIDDSIFSIG